MLTPQGGGQPLRVPYAGFKGDYQSIQVLAAGGCSFPMLASVGGSTECRAATATAPAVVLNGYTKQTGGTTYTLERPDRPTVLYHRAHQSRSIQISAIDVATGTSYPVASGQYVSRNATNDLATTGYSVYTWDGKYVADNGQAVNRRELADGQYQLRLTVLKALGDAANPAHVETWTSPSFTIDRPE